MDVVIIGAGGHGKVVLDILACAQQHRVVGFLDSDPNLHGSKVAGVTVLGGLNQLIKLKQQKVRGAITAIGDNRVRTKFAQELVDAGFELISAVHPSSVVARSATIGKNVVIAAGAVVCTETQIADSVIVNTSAVVDHECVIGQGVHICPGALLAGRVRVEEQAFIGMGAKVIQCLTIGARAVIGAGAVVRSDVPPDCTAVGCACSDH